MYKIYNDENKEMPHRKRDDISFFEDDEKHAINEDTNKKTNNPNYTKAKSDARKKEIYIFNVLNSGNVEALAEYNTNRCDTAHEYYDYNYARTSAADGYGPLEKQIEHISENGLASWKSFVTQVKDRYPKP